MARHSGKNGIIKIGTNVIGGLRGWSIDETIGKTDLTAAGDTWETHDATYKAWSGSFNLLLDDAAGANQTMRAGDSVTIEAYSEGSASTKNYFTGTATITSVAVDAQHDGDVTRGYQFTGNGALTIATVP